MLKLPRPILNITLFMAFILVLFRCISALESKGEKAELARVLEVRHWSNPTYTRVVISVDKAVGFKGHLLPEDPEKGLPLRIYVDIFNSRLGAGLKEVIPVGDSLLKKARYGQFTHTQARVVLDVERIDSYKVFPLKNPFRIVIDLRRSYKKALPMDKDKEFITKRRKRKIVIDPGHGGKDLGAFIVDLREKDIVLTIAKIMEEKIGKNSEFEVILTREEDIFMPLEERTAIANSRGADLFVSIHLNASANEEAYGIETYFLNITDDKEAQRIAARENATTEQELSDLQMILKDLLLTSKMEDSSRLAKYIHQFLLSELQKSYDEIKDRGVKHAPFYVLIGAEMPSVLVEASFITNPMEANRLKQQSYLDSIAQAILRGIELFVQELNLVGS